MANDGFNGSTIALGGTSFGSLRSIDVTVGGATVDISASGDVDEGKTWVNGLDDVEIGVEFIGTPGGALAIGRGSWGALTIKWFDDSTTGSPMTNAICTQITQRGSMDGEITSNATFKKTPTLS
jgi:hypothetical protein